MNWQYVLVFLIKIVVFVVVLPGINTDVFTCSKSFLYLLIGLDTLDTFVTVIMVTVHLGIYLRRLPHVGYLYYTTFYCLHYHHRFEDDVWASCLSRTHFKCFAVAELTEFSIYNF